MSVPVVPSRLLSDYFENVYRIRRLRGRSPNTTRLYRISIRSFAKTLGHAPTFDDLTNDNVSRNMQRMLDDGRSKATVNKEREQILVLWRYAHRHNLVPNWPDVLPEVIQVREPEAWLAADLRKLFDTIETLDGTFGSVPRSLWWKTLLMVTLDTGERIGAVREVQWDWIEHDWLLVPAEVRKGGKRDKRFRLSPETVELLTQVRKLSVSKSVFWWQYCDNYLWKQFKAILIKAGLPHGRRDKFHRIRRTVASAVEAEGLDATKALDHQSRKTTLLYIDKRFSKDETPSHVMERFLHS